jgi:hypothetical protein
VKETNSLFVQGKANADAIIVAAADAPDYIRQNADYQCDGVDDQVEIMAAIASLPTVGGTVQLSTGTFFYSDTIKLVNRKNLTLCGVGTGSKSPNTNDGRGTIIAPAAGVDRPAIEYIQTTAGASFNKFADFTIQGTWGGSTAPVSHGIIIRGGIKGIKPMDIELHRVWVQSFNDGFQIVGDGYKYPIASLTASTFVVVGDASAHFEAGDVLNTDRCTTNASTSDFTVVSSVYNSSTDRTTITVTEAVTTGTANGYIGLKTTTVKAWGIVFDHCLSETNLGYGAWMGMEQCYISKCYFAYNKLTDWYMNKCTQVNFHQNTVKQAISSDHGDGMYWYSGSDNIINGNIVYCSLAATGSTRGIHLYGEDKFTLTGNRVRMVVPGNYTHGIRVLDCFNGAISGNSVSGCPIGLGVIKLNSKVSDGVFASGNTLVDSTIAAEGYLGGKNKIQNGPTSKTVDYAVTTGDSGKVFNNAGDDGTIIFTLPSTATFGTFTGYDLEYTFCVEAAQELRIKPLSTTKTGKTYTHATKTIAGATDDYKNMAVGDSIAWTSTGAGGLATGTYTVATVASGGTSFTIVESTGTGNDTGSLTWGDTICLTDGVQLADGKYITANSAGAMITAYCRRVGQWQVKDAVGTWTAETP